MAMNNNLNMRAMYAHEIIEKEAEDRGFQQGLQQAFKRNVVILWQKNMPPSFIAYLLDLPIKQVYRFIAKFQKQERKE
jgi:hypothetical protein